MSNKNKQYYKQKYEDRMDEIYRELKYEYNIPDNEIDEKCTYEFDDTANAEEVVGYYLINYEWEPLKGWLENLQYVQDITEQDKEVTRILKELAKEEEEE